MRCCRTVCSGGAGGVGRLCCSRGAVELLPVLSISEASVWAGPAANTGRVLDDAVAVEETVELEVSVELVEPGVVLAPPPLGAEVLAVQLRPHVVAEADKGGPVAVTGQRLAAGADTPACSVGGSLSARIGSEENLT